MTEPFRKHIDCPYCKRIITEQTAFGRWIRERHADGTIPSKSYFVMDQDWWVHGYRIQGSREFQLIMGVEIKQFGKPLDDGQRDTIFALDQLLTNRRETPTKPLKHQSGTAPLRTYSSVLRRKVSIRCYGMHVLRFSDSGPDDSEWIKWDKFTVSPQQLVEILAFRLDPDKPAHQLDYSRLHHRRNPTMEIRFPEDSVKTKSDA